MNGIEQIPFAPALKLTGAMGTRSYFQFVEGSGLDYGLVLAVLREEAAGCIFRGLIPPQVCDAISTNFWQNPSLRQREDGVPAFYVGTYHYQKELSDYFQEAAAARAVMAKLFDSTDNFIQAWLAGFSGYLAVRGMALRPAADGRREAAAFIMRSWSGAGDFALKPHDDFAQMRDPRQAGFEIQEVCDHAVVAFNACIENGVGGSLCYWNLQPDDVLRSRLGLELTGYPYPLDVLETVPKLTIPIRRGDVYLFNGKNIHAVGPQSEHESRLTISLLMGFKDPRTVIYWT